MDHGGRSRHTVAMGPHPRQQSTQQSTNIICDGSTLLKLDFFFITSNITINAHRVDVDEQRRRCSNATMGAVQPAGWYRRFRRRGDAPNSTMAGGGGGGGRGLRTSNVVTTQEKKGTLGLW